MIVEPESFFTGAEEHEGDSEYSGTVYNGGLRFNANSEFILNNVTVYTNTDGERTIELQDINGTVLLSQLVNIPASEQGTVINLNWSVPQGNNLILTTNTAMNNDNFGDNNPMLRRTTDDLPNFPYSIDNILEITEGMYDDGDGQGFSTSYYYYFYNWDVTTLGASCYSDPIEVNVIVGESISGCTDEEACNFNVDATLDDDSCIYSLVGYDCDGNCLDGYIDINGECIFGVSGCTDPDAFNYDENANIDDGSCEYNSSIEEANNYFTVFPNPANDLINIEFHKSSEDINIIIFNTLGELVNKIHTGNVQNNQIFSIKLDKLSPGIYVVHAIDQNTTIKQLFTINR